MLNTTVATLTAVDLSELLRAEGEGGGGRVVAIPSDRAYSPATDGRHKVPHADISVTSHPAPMLLCVYNRLDQGLHNHSKLNSS